MDKLIDSNNGDGIVNNVINKLFDAVELYVNRDTPKKKAVNDFVNEIEKMDIDPLVKAAYKSNAKKIIKEYCNKEDVVKDAIQFLHNDAMPENIEEDWLNQFMDKAKLVSSEEFQIIWGMILAKECNEPGSIPLVLLHTLDKMDKDDADSFTALCRVSVKIDDLYEPIIINSKLTNYESLVGLQYDNLVSLSALGLIETSLGDLKPEYKEKGSKVPLKVTYFDEAYENIGSDYVIVGNVIFTKAGQALCQSLYQSLQVEKVDGFWETFCLPFWMEKAKMT